MNIEKIKQNLKYRLIGSKYMKSMVIKTIRILPDEIANIISKQCWFVGSFEDGYAFVIRGDEIKKDEHLVFLSDELLKEKESQIMYSIVHEIGHVILGHRNSIGSIQSKAEIRRQEKEADEFSRKYLH